MKKFLTLTTIVVLVSVMAMSVKASPQSTAALQRRLAWTEQHIDQLNHRRAYLHRFIRHLRKQTQPAPASTGSSDTTSTSTTSSSTSTSSSSYPSSGVLSDAQLASLLRQVGFPESAISTMIYYAHRESGGNPRAINPSSGACGLYQLYPCYGGSAWLDPLRNTQLAFQKYQASGFSPWGG